MQLHFPPSSIIISNCTSGVFREVNCLVQFSGGFSEDKLSCGEFFGELFAQGNFSGSFFLGGGFPDSKVKIFLSHEANLTISATYSLSLFFFCFLML